MTTKKSTSTRTAPAPRMSAEQRAYQAQDDLRTIQRATEIQADKKRMVAVQKQATSQIAALNSVAKRK